MSVAVCIIVKDNYLATKYCIENLLNKTSEAIDLFIFDNGSKDERLIQYCKEVSVAYHREINECNFIAGYNKLFKFIDLKKHEYICTFQSDLVDLRHWIEGIQDSGVVAIKTSTEKMKLTPLLFGEELKQVWIPDTPTVYGVCLFRPEVLYNIGGYNEHLNAKGYEQDDFCLRIAFLGKRNFYIVGQEAIRTGIISECNNPTKTKEGLEVFKKITNELVRTERIKKVN
jgi:glycosyltransferase involved in cell wall biosynthesis